MGKRTALLHGSAVLAVLLTLTSAVRERASLRGGSRLRRPDAPAAATASLEVPGPHGAEVSAVPASGPNEGGKVVETKRIQLWWNLAPKRWVHVLSARSPPA